jgi:hypothetical protein
MQWIYVQFKLMAEECVTVFNIKLQGSQTLAVTKSEAVP